MMSGTLEKIFKKAAAGRFLIEFTDAGNRKRVAEPYGIFYSNEGILQLCCFQVSGYSKSGLLPNWRNPHLASIQDIRILESTFVRRVSFEPGNHKIYPHWKFHI